MNTIKSKNFDKYKVRVPKCARVPIESPPDLFKVPCLQLVCGAVGSGKSVYATNLLRLMKEANLCDKVIWISPTHLSNSALLAEIGVEECDRLDPTEKGCVDRIIKIMDDERDQYELDLDRRDRWRGFKKMYIDAHTSVYNFDNHDILEFTDINSGALNPEPRMTYDNACKGRPQVFAIFDDCISTKLFECNRKMLNLALRLRHCAPLKYRPNDPERCGALSLSCLFLVQCCKAQRGGCPKQIRANATQIVLIGKTSSKKELDDIQDQISGQVDPDDFEAAREYALQGPHDSLLIDLLPKDDVPSIFRKGLAEYILPRNKE